MILIGRWCYFYFLRVLFENWIRVDLTLRVFERKKYGFNSVPKRMFDPWLWTVARHLVCKYQQNIKPSSHKSSSYPACITHALLGTQCYAVHAWEILHWQTIRYVEKNCRNYRRVTNRGISICWIEIYQQKCGKLLGFYSFGEDLIKNIVSYCSRIKFSI